MRRVLTSRGLFRILVIFAMANVIMFAIQRWAVLPLHVPSSSMEPSLQAGDRILVRRSFASSSELAGRLDRGDVLVFRAPREGAPLVVKRVIALPNEMIQARDGVIAIDNRTTLVEKWLPEEERRPGSAAAATVDIEPTQLAEDEVFVLGDNREHSIDSRSFGPVRLDAVVGTVLVRYLPLSRVGTVDWS